MYSQNDEEKWIVDYFQSVDPSQSSFLDIGAYDGKTFSNTLRLVELGWQGLCVEPSPSCFVRLLELHRNNPRIQLLNAALIPGSATRVLTFHDSSGDAISTLVEARTIPWRTTEFRKFYVPALPLETVFAQFGSNFEFLNLDVEGMNIALFRALPLAQMPRLRLICAEHDGHYGEMMAITGQLGFSVLAHNPENIILKR